jgi:hypothetical protein
MFTIVIESDFNDADYITTEFSVDEDRFLYIQDLCRRIKESKIDFRVDTDSYSDFEKVFEGVLTVNEISWLYDSIPRDEMGYGRLESIRFYVGEPTTLL